MKVRQVLLMIFLISARFGCTHASNLNGTASVVFKNQHHVFNNGEIAQGYVRLNNGFTIVNGAAASLDTVVSVSGDIDLRQFGTMNLLTDLVLDSGVTITQSGRINGRGHGIVLNGNLTIPASKILHFTGDTFIDGNGATLELKEHAQLQIDANATLTLRNLTFKNTRNSLFSGPIRINSSSSKLAFDNVILNPIGDMPFSFGKIYIHNDVIFSGTSALVYYSSSPLFVAPHSRFLFDISTAFSFAPTGTDAKNLFILQDRTSTLHLNGCTLNTTASGMQITKGNLILENKVILNTRNSSTFSTLTSVTSFRDQDVSRVRWSPTGKYLALVDSGGVGRSTLIICEFDGVSLTITTSRDYGNSSGSIVGIDWSPDEQYVVIGGGGPSGGGNTGFAAGNTNALRVYQFNGSTLTGVASVHPISGGTVYTTEFSPDGKYIAAGLEFPTTSNELAVYSFNGSSLTLIDDIDWGADGAGTRILDISWHPTGQYLACGGSYAGGVGDEFKIFSFDGTTIASVTSKSYGGGTGQVHAVKWHPSGTTVAIGGRFQTAVGGFTATEQLRLYNFNGTTLTALTGKAYGTRIHACSWDQTGSSLLIGGYVPSSGGGFANTDELRIYSFDGLTLTPLASVDYSTIGGGTVHPNWRPGGEFFATGGSTPSAVGGFVNDDTVRIYRPDFSFSNVAQSFNNGLVFGNSSVGASANLNVEILGAAHVTINGVVSDDSV
ncbi:hypothetical protein JST56_01190 [Candidatus Dependentiae bacterium]|nr:hypothetical protein [Candidatus Dependentiae bacterium]